MKIIMNRIRKIIFSNTFKNLSTLMSGTVIAQLIGILASPLLSRLYTPSNFGLWGTFLSIVAVITVIASLKYELGIILEEKEESAILLTRFCFLLSLSIGIISTIIALFAIKYSTTFRCAYC